MCADMLCRKNVILHKVPWLGLQLGYQCQLLQDLLGNSITGGTIKTGNSINALVPPYTVFIHEIMDKVSRSKDWLPIKYTQLGSNVRCFVRW